MIRVILILMIRVKLRVQFALNLKQRLEYGKSGIDSNAN